MEVTAPEPVPVEVRVMAPAVVEVVSILAKTVIADVEGAAVVPALVVFSVIVVAALTAPSFVMLL